MPGVCQLGSFLRHCHGDVVGCCQYCGREFCGSHGVHLNGNQDVCLRRICQEKVVELEGHLEYRGVARQRSARGLCGTPACSADRAGQCSKCGALFCGKHLHDAEETVRRGLSSFSRPASFCDHCLARRKLWSRL